MSFIKPAFVYVACVEQTRKAIELKAPEKDVIEQENLFERINFVHDDSFSFYTSRPAGGGKTQPIVIKKTMKNFSADSWEFYGTGAYLLAGSKMLKLEE